MKAAIGALMVLVVGCSQMLGLEDTKFEQRDAMTDAPSNCDASPRCMSTTGRSVCGQLYGTGTTAGQLLRASSPTGETCATLGSTAGPCAYSVYAQAVTAYYMSDSASRIAGEIDDCGRYVVNEVDTAIDDVAVVFDGADIAQSVTLLLDRSTTAGADQDVDAYLVGTSVPMTWAMQVDSANPPTIESAYLVTYVNTLGEPIPMQELRINGGAVGGPPTSPWGSYFSGDGAYGTADPAATATATSGSAIVVPAASPFMLGGFRPGKNCTPVSVEPHANAFIHLALSC